MTVSGAGTTHFRRSVGMIVSEASRLSSCLCQSYSKNPPADVPVRVRQPVVAVAAGETRITDPVVQVAEAKPLKPPADTQSIPILFYSIMRGQGPLFQAY